MANHTVYLSKPYEDALQEQRQEGESMGQTVRRLLEALLGDNLDLSQTRNPVLVEKLESLESSFSDLSSRLEKLESTLTPTLEDSPPAPKRRRRSKPADIPQENSA